MSEFEPKKREPRWYNRGIGTFCGGFLGFLIAGLAVMIIGDLGLPVGLMAIAGGTAAGLTVGYFFPNATETLFWTLSIFG